MSISKIPLKRYRAFLAPLGRVVAIHPVKTHSEAARWQKEACIQTWWVHKSGAHMQVYERARLLRMWYTMRVYRAGMDRRVHGDA